jgi:hypothetical protein
MVLAGGRPAECCAADAVTATHAAFLAFAAVFSLASPALSAHAVAFTPSATVQVVPEVRPLLLQVTYCSTCRMRCINRLPITMCTLAGELCHYCLVLCTYSCLLLASAAAGSNCCTCRSRAASCSCFCSAASRPTAAERSLKVALPLAGNCTDQHSMQHICI